MKTLFQKYRIVVVAPILLIITLIFLEIPRYYYKQMDEKILKEIGISQHTEQTVKSIDSFLQKADAFRDYDSTSTIGYTYGLSEAELDANKDLLLKEFHELTGGVYQNIVEMMCKEGVESRGIQMQVISVEDATGEKSVWNVGYCEISFPASGGSLTFIYDVDTYKIFISERNFPDKYYEMSDHVTEDSILEYYEYWVSEDFYSIKNRGSGTISLFSLFEIENSKLLEEIMGLVGFYLFDPAEVTIYN